MTEPLALPASNQATQFDLVFPLLLFQHLLRALADQPERGARLNLSRWRNQWLVRDFSWSGSRPVSAEALRAVLVGEESQLPDPLPTEGLGILAIGRGALRGQVWWLASGEESTGVLHLRGGGLHSLPLLPPGHAPAHSQVHPVPPRWSRTVGALGESAWRRLVSQRFAVVGCGRTGSLLAAGLVRLGVAAVALIDPDYIDAHNLGEADLLLPADLHRPKAEALAGHLRKLSVAPNRIQAIHAALDSPPGLEAVQSADIVVGCADSNGARLLAAVNATLHHKILLDIGAGIFLPSEADGSTHGRHMGADVRLIVPGDGCLLCRGNLTNYHQALSELFSKAQSPAPWWRQRAGSLRSLNQMAVGLGLRLLEDLAAERINGSVWASLEFDGSGRVQVDYPNPPPATEPCPLCARAGWGQGG